MKTSARSRNDKLWFKVKVNARFQSEDGVDLQTLPTNKALRSGKEMVMEACKQGEELLEGIIAA